MQNEYDVSQYDMATLVQWYIDLRTQKSEVKKSIEPTVAEIDNLMDKIDGEMAKRLAEQGTTSMRTTKGTVLRVEKTKYPVVDPAAFKDWVRNNPDVGIGLISISANTAEITEYIANGSVLPDGLAVEKILDISVRRS